MPFGVFISKSSSADDLASRVPLETLAPKENHGETQIILGLKTSIRDCVKSFQHDQRSYYLGYDSSTAGLSKVSPSWRDRQFLKGPKLNAVYYNVSADSLIRLDIEFVDLPNG